MFVIVSYDIVCDRKRYRVVKTLLNYGHRVQKSVFECRVDERNYLKLKKEIDKIIDHNDDSVRYYQLCARCLDLIEISGWGSPTEKEDLIIA